MDQSPPRTNAASINPRRPLFPANRQEKSARRHNGDGQARRRLLLGAPDEDDDSVINSSGAADDAAGRGANVVARLMGLESLPVSSRLIPREIEAVSSSSSGGSSLASSCRSSPVMIRRESGAGVRVGTGVGQQLRLQELLRIKEPLLLRELLRETEEQQDHRKKGSSLVEKLAGLVRRTRIEADEAADDDDDDEKENLKGGAKNNDAKKVSPIKSPSKNKRGLVAEAAVKIVDSDRLQQQHQTLDDRKLSRRRFSLNRSSSEPTLGSSSSSSTSSFTSRKLAKLSESIRQRFGSSSGSGSGSSSNSTDHNPSSSSRSKNKGNLVRSKSDLGFQQQDGAGPSWSDIRKLHKQQKQHQDIIKNNDNEQDRLPKRASFSRTEKLAAMKNPSSSSSNGIISYTTNRLFGNNRGKEKGRKITTGSTSSGIDRSGKVQPGSTRATPSCDTAGKSETSPSLMRSLLRRSRSRVVGAGATEQAAGSSQSVGKNSSSDSTLSSRQRLADDVSLSSAASSSSSCTTNGIPSRFCDELLSDDSRDSAAPSERSGSSPTSSNGGNFDCSSSRSSSRSEGGQPSPVSVLEPPFVDEIQSSPLDSSGEDSPDTKIRTSSASSDSILNAILDISRIRCIDLASVGLIDAAAAAAAAACSSGQSLEEEAEYIEDVLVTSQLLSSRPGAKAETRSWLSQASPIGSQVFSILETTMSTTRKNHSRSSLLSRKLIFDCVAEAVESRFGSVRSWDLGAGSARLIGIGMKNIRTEVEHQIRDWRSMAALQTDELVDRDMSFGAGKWTDRNEQVEMIVRDVECSILRTMIDELVSELRA